MQTKRSELEVIEYVPRLFNQHGERYSITYAYCVCVCICIIYVVPSYSVRVCACVCACVHVRACAYEYVSMYTSATLSDPHAGDWSTVRMLATVPRGCDRYVLKPSCSRSRVCGGSLPSAGVTIHDKVDSALASAELSGDDCGERRKRKDD
jgi:hypothetical protein